MRRIRTLLKRDRWRRAGPLALVLILAIGGCQGAQATRPKTYPVHGKIMYKGGEPLTGGTVQFQSVADSSFTTMAEIQQDGTFTLFTLINNKKYLGSLPGDHRVTVIPRMGADQVLQEVKPLQPVWTVEPRENDFTIEVEKVPPRR